MLEDTTFRGSLWGLSWRTKRPAGDISVLLFLGSHKSLQPHPLAPGFLLRLESSLIGAEAATAAAAAASSEADRQCSPPCPLGTLPSGCPDRQVCSRGRAHDRFRGKGRQGDLSGPPPSLRIGEPLVEEACAGRQDPPVEALTLLLILPGDLEQAALPLWASECTSIK